MPISSPTLTLAAFKVQSLTPSFPGPLLKEYAARVLHYSTLSSSPILSNTFLFQSFPGATHGI
ncbi:hypothetical protein E2C01_027276 [Portunus trituberculatus]|uniref:Uncharacterized protein n=1 Tax=Portunus trituberculatus TaxID=210409 RepID=A0A5B7EKQ1_PORTR|nr:hypothetical protein [Portunus trituberculatus]